jgi:hypothetical protein
VRNEKWVSKIAARLATEFRYRDKRLRIRYILFSRSLSKGYAGRLQHIGFEEIIRFLDEQRGQSWKNFGLGVASEHGECDPLIHEMFKIFNGEGSSEQRQERALRLLENYDRRAPERQS